MLASEAPRFLVPSKRIQLLHEPRDFYKYLCERISAAKRRVFLASLYLGKTEHELVSIIEGALRKNEQLHVYVLLDALRGTREAPQACSASLLAPLAAQFPSRVRLAMYKTPKLGPVASWLLPRRVVEGVGLQHMKLYGFDDEILLSGANLSSDYFENRQDRYVSIKDRSVTSWFFNIHQEVSNLSLALRHRQNEQGFALEEPQFSSHEREEIYKRIRTLMAPSYSGADRSTACTKEHTEVYPLCQFAPLGLGGTEHGALIHALRSLPSKSSFLFTAGYFNVEAELGSALAQAGTASKGELILASPEANGFYESPGASGRIPHYYSVLAWRYLRHASNLTYREWRRGQVNLPGGWSYHAKGFWATPAGAKYPEITYIGSSNFTRRSYTHDLECGAVLMSRGEDLGKQLQNETNNLLEYCGPSESAASFTKPKQSVTDRILLKLFGNRL